MSRRKDNNSKDRHGDVTAAKLVKFQDTAASPPSDQPQARKTVLPKEHVFRERLSIMERPIPDLPLQDRPPSPSHSFSSVANSDLYVWHVDGIVNLFAIGLVFCTVTCMYEQWKLTGDFIDLTLLRLLSHDLWQYFAIVIPLCLLSFVVVLIEKARLLTGSKFVERFYGSLTQMLVVAMFMFAITAVIRGNVAPISSAAVVAECTVLVMKVISYYEMNRRLAVASRSGQALHRHIIPQNADADAENTTYVIPVKYPQNVTFANYLDFLLVPTLVYEPYYPRNKERRWGFLAGYMLGCFGCMVLLYTTVNRFMFPIFVKLRELDFLESLFRLALPSVVCWCLLFFIVFHCILNGFAEITRFADREFYEDWWNSTAFDEFARKWNKPIHEWLFRHVYLDTLRYEKTGSVQTGSMKEMFKHRLYALLGTFFLSGILHELVLAVTFRMLRFYLFFLMGTQVMCIYVSRIPFVRRQRRIGNIVVWCGFFFGFPLIFLLYTCDYYIEHVGASEPFKFLEPMRLLY
eukprot:gnl/Spiro4/6962_TR3611_c0_g1_i1.p1 gnl/Spiro4/6962_TR3611_c0_g1~~gnl/Spiro4/6962_TR3611_c0_g1_i1.p1  ORF type:complete len:519 (+),score=160.66 gnl/Spiro4/6962_TR3611_c0_g1_i1:35-1591(+)